jgi:hypothetical protein
MKPVGKTPYEIRLDLLQLSFDILSNKYRAVDTARDNVEVYAPTTEDVIAEAEKMNSFISKANHPQ